LIAPEHAAGGSVERIRRQQPVQSLTAALELFQGDNGRFPTSQEGMQALLVRPQGLDNWSGPYLHGKDQLKDPWGNPYRYTVNGASVTVASLGADNKPGGEGADRDVSASVP